MKLPTLITFLVVATNTFAKDIEIESAQIACLGNTNNIYTYGIELVVKNTSKKNISIISKTNHALIAHHEDDESAEISISHSPELVNKVPIIPVQEALGIVNIFPGEGAKIDDQVSNRKLFKYATVKFNSPDAYGLRFHNWVGVVKTKKLKVHGFDSCTL